MIPVYLFAAFYVFGIVVNLMNDSEVAPIATVPAGILDEVAIFGASGTAGDGILKALLADPDVGTIHVITRRATPRIDQGVTSGKVVMTEHMDYLDYAAVMEQLADVQAVFWSIGTSSRNVDNETYSVIHVDFPVRFVEEWLQSSQRPGIEFHYISSSDISEDASMYWAREKWRAEKELFALAEGTRLKVIAWRPDYIAPTEEEAHLGQKMLYWFFAPVGVALKAVQIGEAMLDVTARGSEFSNGDKFATGKILRYSEAYRQRVSNQP